MKKKSKSILILVTLLFFLGFYLFHASYMIQCFLDYTHLFLQKLFPVSFTFFLLSSLLIQYGIIEAFSALFSINTSSFYVFLLSLLSGFPSGAKYTKELLEKEMIDLEEAKQILMFSHFPNPLFVLGSVSTLIGKEYSLKLLFSIILSNFILFCFSKKKRVKNSISFSSSSSLSFSSALYHAILSSFQTILLIYGTSLFFYLLSVVVTTYFSFSPILFVFLNGVFDLTKGVFSTSILSNFLFRSLFILFFISFGGISIHMQVFSILSDTNLSYSPFLKGRILGTILAFLLFFLFLFL